jgi:hypothetical protein
MKSQQVAFLSNESLASNTKKENADRAERAHDTGCAVPEPGFSSSGIALLRCGFEAGLQCVANISVPGGQRRKAVAVAVSFVQRPIFCRPVRHQQWWCEERSPNPRHSTVAQDWSPSRMDRPAWENHQRVSIPSPLGELTSISDWDIGRASSPTLDERYNLIGLGWAAFTCDVEFAAQLVRRGRVSFELAVTDLIEDCPAGIRDYIQHSHNRKRVERELKAVIDGIQDDRPFDELAKSWTM